MLQNGAEIWNHFKRFTYRIMHAENERPGTTKSMIKGKPIILQIVP